MRSLKRFIRYFFIIIPITSVYLMCFVYETSVLFKQQQRQQEQHQQERLIRESERFSDSQDEYSSNRINSHRVASSIDPLPHSTAQSVKDEQSARSGGIISLQQISYSSSSVRKSRKQGNLLNSDVDDDENQVTDQVSDQKITHSSVTATSTLTQPIKLVLKEFKPTTISLSDFNTFHTTVSSSTLLDLRNFTFMKDARATCVTGTRDSGRERVIISVTSLRDLGKKVAHNDENNGMENNVNISASSLTSSPSVSASSRHSPVSSSSSQSSASLLSVSHGDATKLPSTGVNVINSQPMRPFLVAFIHSSPSNFARRSIIRKTWASESIQSTLNIRVVFILGLSTDTNINKLIDNEYSEYSDLVQGNFIDSYKNLTYKHLTGYKWVMSNCHKSTFVMKVDDDAFVDIHKVVSTLKHMFTSGYSDEQLTTVQPGGILACSVFPEGTPVRRHGKWALSRSEYPAPSYPEYCSGVAYFASTDVLFKLFNKAHEKTANGMLESKPIWIDDLYVTGILASLTQQKHLPMNFQFAYDHRRLRNWLSRRDNNSNSFLIADIGDVSDWSALMIALWNKVQRVKS